MQLCRHLSKSDAITLLELIQQCISCDNEEKFREIMKKLPSLFPHENAISMMAKTGENGMLNSYDAINLSYPSEWVAMYIAQSQHKCDPILKANYQNLKLQYFEDVFMRYDSPKIFHGITKDFGIVDGYVHGVRNHAGTRGSMFCFSGRQINRDKRTEAILELVVPHLHQAFTRTLNQDGKNGSGLSPKEKEILKWLKAGKSTWDISVILGIGERTVKFHVSNIMQKLDASSRTHAVAIAMERGIVGVD